MTETKEIRTDYLARVEGEGAMRILVERGEVTDVQLRIYEPPRFFEAFLRGRAASEAPDITARICGICPVAYQMSAVNAIEGLAGVDPGPRVRALRRLLYCGEWIESHALHVFMLHAPDFLGYDSAIELARDRPDVVEHALLVKKTGNALMQVAGGREIHPINVRVGGFYKAPSPAALRALRDDLERSLELAVTYAGWAAGLDYPDYERDYLFVSLREPGEYPIDRGRIVSGAGLDIPVAEYEAHFAEEHVEHSNALHSTLGGEPYLVGPLARFALNREELTGAAAEIAATLEPVVRNPFRSLLVRLVELAYACEEALRLVDAYEPPAPAWVEVPPRAGVGHGATEAPRGVLYHRYELDASGTILAAKIVPPTSQNQKSIEADLRAFVAARVDMPDDELRRQCEQAIRNYDPCISCATHFLTLDVERR